MDNTKGKALVITDLQNDFVSGVFANNKAKELVPKIVDKINKFDGKKIFLVMDIHFKEIYKDCSESKFGYPFHCEAMEDGWKLVPEIEEAIKDKEYEKVETSTFGYSYWNECFDGFESVEICGLYTNEAVIANAYCIRSVYPNIDIRILQDLCIGKREKLHNEALDILGSSDYTIE